VRCTWPVLTLHVLAEGFENDCEVLLLLYVLLNEVNRRDGERQGEDANIDQTQPSSKCNNLVRDVPLP